MEMLPRSPRKLEMAQGSLQRPAKMDARFLNNFRPVFLNFEAQQELGRPGSRKTKREVTSAGLGAAVRGPGSRQWVGGSLPPPSRSFPLHRWEDPLGHLPAEWLTPPSQGVHKREEEGGSGAKENRSVSQVGRLTVELKGDLSALARSLGKDRHWAKRKTK